MYIDPGSSSFIIQILIGAAAGVGLAIATFWRRLLLTDTRVHAAASILPAIVLILGAILPWASIRSTTGSATTVSGLPYSGLIALIGIGLAAEAIFALITRRDPRGAVMIVPSIIGLVITIVVRSLVVNDALAPLDVEGAAGDFAVTTSLGPGFILSLAGCVLGIVVGVICWQSTKLRQQGAPDAPVVPDAEVPTDSPE